MNNKFDKNTVFFLGAGFSKAINNKYYTLQELSNKVFRNSPKQALLEHYKSIPDKYKNNIENFLTYLFLDLPWKSEKQKYLDRALYIDITEKIVEAFDNIDITEKIAETPDNIDKDFSILFKFMNNCECNTNITLNYDILLEKNIFDTLDENYQRCNSYEGFYKIPILSLNDRYKAVTNGFFSVGAEDHYGNLLSPILKLHGSINWLWSGINSTDPIYCLNKNTINGLKSLSTDLVRYIIPPVLDKQSFYKNNILKSVWKQSYEKIKSANEIYIIGFSFPETDMSVRYLFQSALKDNNDVKIYVINVDTDTKLQDKYVEVFNKEQLNFNYCCKNALCEFITNKLKQGENVESSNLKSTN